jgi:hypothetical protein
MSNHLTRGLRQLRSAGVRLNNTIQLLCTPPGPVLPPAMVYVCPEDDCDYDFVVLRFADPTPYCPDHGFRYVAA